MKNKHTPGPWSFGSDLNDKQQAIEASGFIHIAMVDASIPNARLIAAAPEMFQLLERLEESLGRDASAGDTYDSFTLATGVLRDIHLLLIKARGDR